MEIIRLENATKIYHIGEVETRALNGVNMTIEEGEFTAIGGAIGFRQNDHAATDGLS